MMQVPFEWQTPARSGVPPPYWVTYYGEIYSGWYMSHFPANDRFFILSNNQFRDYQNLKVKSVESLQKMAWEIRDVRIITDFIHNMDNLGDTNVTYSYPGDTQKMRRMFIFGAGASAFCSFNEKQDELNCSPLKPPTGYEIFDSRFDKIIGKYEGALASLPAFEANGRDIEAYLEKDWALIRDSYSPHLTTKHINIQFYIQDLFRQISEEVVTKYSRYNLYGLLCDKVINSLSVRGEKASFISFNYDTILDTFLERSAQVRFADMSNYISMSNVVRLFKPHGSCNWGWPFMMNALGNMGGKSISKYLYDSRFTPNQIYYNLLGGYKKMVYEGSWGIESEMNENNMGRYTQNKNNIGVINGAGTYLPALLLPYSDKDDFVMPYDHYHYLANAMFDVEDLFLIGWKGNESAFNRLMKIRANNLKRIIIVNPDAESVKKNISTYFDLSAGQTRITIDVVPGFKEFVTEKLDGYLDETKNSNR
jgi:hypothetical protein